MSCLQVRSLSSTSLTCLYIRHVDMPWYLNPTIIHLRRARVLTQPDREATPRDLPALSVLVLKTDHARMVSSILFSLVGERGTGPPPPVLLGHLLDTTGQTQIHLRLAE